ncbi:MAG: hypothetical protein GY880_01615 [Planctomycetaceae bacterium]|nr:hypothetical protein [Planctomycetaceae bacterium]MCP4772915.1 hypothetical protein [Planctomycetaceae bacterium]
MSIQPIQLQATTSSAFEITTPPSRAFRLQELARILKNRNVPYPIDSHTAQAYHAFAESGTPFGIGSLTESTVDLAEHANSQNFESLTTEEHQSWARLIEDQQATKHRYACREYLQGEQLFEINEKTIPDYYLLNARIYQQTGWQLATVSDLIPANIFFHCHSRKFFPVTTFMRPLGAGYLEEPDIGHDIAGHVATFTIPQVARVMNNHGLANDLIHQEKHEKLRLAESETERQAIENAASELLLLAGRLYWFTVEFGLVLEDQKLKAFGAGILSSPSETIFSIDSPKSNRILIDIENDRDLLRLATTDYLISEFQKTYFVMKDFDALDSLTPERILATVRTAKNLPHHTWMELVPGDNVHNVGTVMMSPLEKYNRLLANQQMDQCLTRTAIRNLMLYQSGTRPRNALEDEFLQKLPTLPISMLSRFSNAKQNGNPQYGNSYLDGKIT